MNWLLVIIGLFVGAILLLQFMAVRRAKQSEGRLAPDTSAVDGPAGEDGRRVYYFHAVHCGSCRAATPVVDRLHAEHRNLIKVDVAEHPELARAFGIAATPSYIVVDDGRISQVNLGPQSESKLRGLLTGTGV